MEKHLLLWLALGILFTNTFAQNHFPPAYEIVTDTAIWVILPDSNWQMLEDKKGKWTIDEVSQSPLNNSFHSNRTRETGIDYSIHTYWFRFHIRNTMNHEVKIGFSDPGFQGRSELFVQKINQVWLRQINGWTTPWSKMDGLRLIQYIPISILPGEEVTVYRRIYDSYFFYNIKPAMFSISFGFTDRVIQKSYIQDESHYFNSIHDSFFFGVMLLAAVFNFAFFLLVREKTYLYFALYVFFLGLGRFNIENELYHTFFRESPLLYLILFAVVWLPSLVFLIYFIRHLLETPKYYPRWDKWLFYSNIFYIVVYLFLTVAVPFTSRKWDEIPFLIYAENLLGLSLIITLFISINKVSKFNRLILLFILPSFCIWIVGVNIGHYLLRAEGIIENPFLYSWFLEKWYLIETICLFWQVLCFSWIMFHRYVELRNRLVQKELEKEIERSQLIADQKTELEIKVRERTSELNQSLQDLKSTQSQLIQSEKMASLGELTAGIAHEIQNPLNFVNNFSELNKELIDEASKAIKSGNPNEAVELLSSLWENEDKISNHGKRADSIVKGMLLHSRETRGQKEPADLNALADEYFRLSYQGLRARDKSFNIVLKTDFDSSIGKINIIPQDIGRVLLNLYNNAFYAVSEKKKIQPESYEPTVSVSTKKINGKVEIKVKDNGNGIPKRVIDKIFQPFFTTKPTGQGTGLGLSLSYDIIKAHGGEIKVETKEGEFTEFVIHLPVSS